MRTYLVDDDWNLLVFVLAVVTMLLLFAACNIPDPDEVRACMEDCRVDTSACVDQCGPNLPCVVDCLETWSLCLESCAGEL